jgi:hypothetical protein
MISKDHKHFSVIMTINAAQTTLTWHTEVIEGVKIGPYIKGFTLPRDIVLTKL